MLYEFARKYCTIIEKFDDDNWENEIQNSTEEVKRGASCYRISKYLKAIIHVYWDFIEDEKLMENKIINTIEQGYLLIGRLLTLGGYEEYNEERELNKKDPGYQSEADFYDQKLKKHWLKKRTK
jgi:hypothetical protein